MAEFKGNSGEAIRNRDDNGNAAPVPGESKPSATDPFFSGRKHFPALDGVRGLAVLLVMSMHYIGALPAGSILRFPWCEGWVGVDLFFVLSGFLITGILYDAKGQEHYFRNFYARRFLRIFPLYYGVLLLVAVGLLALRLHSPQQFAAHPERRRLLADMPWLWTYTVNVMSSCGVKAPPFLSHFWSLSVEEQFYVLWPAVVFWVSRRRLVGISFGLIAGALALRLLLTALGVSATGPIYDLMFCRMDAFAAGAIVALLARGGGGLSQYWGYLRLAFLLGCAAVAVALGMVVFGKFGWSVGPNPFLYQVGSILPAATWPGSPWLGDAMYSALACTFASLIGALAIPSSFGGLLVGFFNLRFLRSAGKYSYALYVFHVPIYISLIPIQAMIDDHWPAFGGDLGGIAWISLNACLAATMAFLSYHLYEKHFLKLKKYFPERTAATAINDQRSTINGQ